MDRSIGSPRLRLAAITVPEESLPVVSKGLKDQISDSLQLRLAETMRDGEKIQPYRDPPNQAYSGFAATLCEELRGYSMNTTSDWNRRFALN